MLYTQDYGNYKDNYEFQEYYQDGTTFYDYNVTQDYNNVVTQPLDYMQPIDYTTVVTDTGNYLETYDGQTALNIVAPNADYVDVEQPIYDYPNVVTDYANVLSPGYPDPIYNNLIGEQNFVQMDYGGGGDCLPCSPNGEKCLPTTCNAATMNVTTCNAAAMNVGGGGDAPQEFYPEQLSNFYGYNPAPGVQNYGQWEGGMQLTRLFGNNTF